MASGRGIVAAARGISLRAKLLINFAALFGVVAVFLAIWVPERMDRMAHEWADRRAESVVTILAAGLSPGLAFGDKTYLEEHLELLAGSSEVVYAVVSAEGAVEVASWHGELRPPSLDVSTPKGPPVLIDDGSILHAVARIDTDAGTTGRLLVGFSLAELQREQRSNMLAGSVVAAGVFGVGMLLTFMVGTVLVRPLQSLTRVATEVSTGNASLVGFHLEVPEHAEDSHDEAVRLTRAISVMAARIAAQVAEIEEERRRALEAEEAALEASAAKSSFLANMSHELRTPLNTILGYSEMIAEECEDAGHDDYIPDLQRIHAAGSHLLVLINDILDLSKIEAGKMELYFEEIEIPELVRNVVATIDPLIKKNGNELVVEMPPGLGAMSTDVTKVRQALFNLLSNASKFTENGEVTLRIYTEVEKGTRMACFEVVDTGIGMTEQQLARLFQAFTQADASTTRKYGGTGLGLALSRKLCHMMGGDIFVRSELGAGSVFTIKLPTLVGGQAAAESQTQAAKPLVLVVDDDPNVRDLMVRNLAKSGFAVEVAGDGEEAIRLARELKPMAITLDVMMPGIDGWSALARLKADPELAEIPVVMCTIVADVNKGFALGAADYLTKPVEWPRLLSVLDRYWRNTVPNPVLLVEDEPNLREIVRRRLEREGWPVVEAENGRVALEQLERVRPAVVLLDLMMPELDGFGFLERLQEREDWRDIPVVVITAMDLSDADRGRLEKSVERILQKGAYSTDELLEEVRRRVTGLVERGPRKSAVG